jgi:hypothetical protein
MNCTEKFIKHSERVGARFAELNAGACHRYFVLTQSRININFCFFAFLLFAFIRDHERTKFRTMIVAHVVFHTCCLLCAFGIPSDLHHNILKLESGKLHTYHDQ